MDTLLRRSGGGVFEIVNQLNRGAALITSRDEREQLAELNLIAGKRAKALPLTPQRSRISSPARHCWQRTWERRRELAFALEFHRAECEFLTGAAGGGGGALDRRFHPAPQHGRASDCHVLARGSVHDPRSERPSGCCHVWTTCGAWASTGRRIRRKPRRDANTSGSGRSWGAARSRSSLSCP